MAGEKAQAEERSKRGKPVMSIRARLILLAVLAITPLMFGRVQGLQNARAEHTERARIEALNLARRGADAQRGIVESMRALLRVVGRVYATMPLDAATCSRYLADLTGDIAWIRTLSVADAKGQIQCSTEPRTLGLNVSDRPHFQVAVQSHDLALSDYFINQTRQMPSLIAAQPAMAADGTVNGVILAAVNLEWITKLASGAAQPAGASAILIDRAGTLVAAPADRERRVGNNLGELPLVKAALAEAEGTIITSGFDGVPRIYGFVKLPWTDAHLAVGLDQEEVEAGIDREMGIAYLQLALIGLFVLLVTWFGGEQLIVRPIRSMVRTVARFGHGDLHARASQENWVAEFAPLAAAFDEMAEKLATREEELHIANEHLEELASLDGLTGLANRRGFDRELERTWRCAIEYRQPVALMMIDIDHFKLYNDRYGHVAGDTCLRAVGETLSLVTLEEAVLVARYGGEEFALLLPGLDLHRAAALAEDARKSIEDLLLVHTQSPSGFVTISIGVDSLVPVKDQPPSMLLEAADTALYAAKRNGRNRIMAGASVPLSMAS